MKTHQIIKFAKYVYNVEKFSKISLAIMILKWKIHSYYGNPYYSLEINTN